MALVGLLGLKRVQNMVSLLLVANLVQTKIHTYTRFELIDRSVYVNFSVRYTVISYLITSLSC